MSSVLRLAGLAVPPPVSATVLERAYTRGTAVHAYAESYATGTIPQTDPDYSPYVDGVRQWYRDFAPVVLFTERRVVSRAKRLTGRIDLGVLLEGHPTLVDYATGTMPPHKGMQVSGYVELAVTNVDLVRLAEGKLWKRLVLELPGNGTYRVKTPGHGLDHDHNDAFFFRAALALVCWRHDHGYETYTDPERPELTADRTVQRRSLLAAGLGESPDYPIF